MVYGITWNVEGVQDSMRKDIVGIEIGMCTTSIVEVKNGEVKNYVSFDTPENAVGADGLIAYEAMADTIKEKLKEEKIQAKDVALVLPDANVYLHKTVMPVMTEKQLLVNLPYEFHDMLQDTKDRYAYDYVVTSVIKDGDTPKEMEILAAAVDKKVIEEYKEMFKRVGLHLVRLEPRELALACFMKNYALDTGDRMLLNLGDTETVLDMYRNGVYDTSRTLDMGLQTIVEESANLLNCDPHVARNKLFTSDTQVLKEESVVDIYNRISVEIMRSINYYSYENQDANLDVLYYYGQGSFIQGLLDAIQENIPVKLLPLQSLNTEEEVLQYAPAAYGIALEK